MRDFLNSILAFIGSTSLTDEEWASLDGIVTEQEYNEANYTALLTILVDRDSVSNVRERLRFYFLAADGTVNDSAPLSSPSNILVGKVLCE